MRIPSFKLRIAILSAGTSGLVLVGLSCSFAAVMSRNGLVRVDRELQALASAQVRTYRPPAHWPRFEEYLLTLYGSRRGEQFLMRVQDAAGTDMFRSPRWPKSLALPRPAAAAGAERPSPLPQPDAGACPPACPPTGYAPAPLLEIPAPRFARRDQADLAFVS